MGILCSGRGGEGMAESQWMLTSSPSRECSLFLSRDFFTDHFWLKFLSDAFYFTIKSLLSASFFFKVNKSCDTVVADMAFSLRRTPFCFQLCYSTLLACLFKTLPSQIPLQFVLADKLRARHLTRTTTQNLRGGGFSALCPLTSPCSLSWGRCRSCSGRHPPG